MKSGVFSLLKTATGRTVFTDCIPHPNYGPVHKKIYNIGDICIPKPHFILVLAV